ncbi:phosphoribosylamine--glycine ligase [Aurantimonas endophytica]|uniref:Phosphoribosylamine--glycine ligase n=1 Tax=Aurantimonas endophytica TaxID=1522175 RepID=A0A7W6MPH3_9HYPH|nr:phosphoribosylamine--glycine ligase [Aurantimonas endophytica]MBB4002958.1 phosphoribosylamine--glycine ligase [Aurantimonas endophytica]MCO6403834.1 phosphoribosylamine--glycine ligase [Aurantimonas endophytica]
MAINVLLIGSGGREHALAWKLAQSPELGTLHAAPGNPGIAEHASLVSLDIADHAAVAAFCHDHDVGLVVVGPEAPLVAGLADALAEAGVPVFGPSAAAAQLEGSKGFTKDLCARHDIPTARYKRFTDASSARDYVEAGGVPVVIKADGLAAGKGVTVAMTRDEALKAVDACFAGEFGAAGAELVVEAFLEGEEASLFCICDGERAVFFGTAQDHKRAFDRDRGPNTGGMGAYSPALPMTEAVTARVMREIIEPTLAGMKEAGTPFRGVLYAGLMLTEEGPQLIEYNVRFGDPECQVLMPRLKSDILPILLASAQGDLSGIVPEWSNERALTVVMATDGYPGTYVTGTEIRSLPSPTDDALIFHAGTAVRDGQLVAVGGRVLNVTATGSSVREAARRAYDLLEKVEWDEGFWRSDIGHRAIMTEPN